jgi:hypothetical protein
VDAGSRQENASNKRAARDDLDRDLTMMKTPVGLVTVALAVATLLAVALLIATGTRGEDHDGAVRMRSPAAKVCPTTICGK